MARKIIFAFIVMLCSALTALANKFSVSGALETHAAYLWRGSRECGAHVIPSLTLEYGNLALQSFGYVSFDGSYKEIDWDLSYKIGDFTLHLADYYARLSSWTTPENYFDFKKGSTNHIQEVILCYEPHKLPFAIRWFTFVGGDWLPNPDGTLGRISFSSYLEPEVYYDIPKAGRLSLLGGLSIFKGSYTSYTRDFAVIHVELRFRRSFSVGNVGIPLQFSYVINPYRKTSWLDVGVGIEF